jgi:putative ABC transport system permease protein
MLANGAAGRRDVGRCWVAVIGLGAWVAVAPAMEGPVGSRIDPFNVPWWLVLTGMLLAVAAATGAAWWPARSTSRIPPVAALSGRPPRPTPVHRSALLSLGFVAAGACLPHARQPLQHDRRRAAEHLVARVVRHARRCHRRPALGPIGGSPPGQVRRPGAGRAEIGVARPRAYQARSGAALAAISLALGSQSRSSASQRRRRTRPARGTSRRRR